MAPPIAVAEDDPVEEIAADLYVIGPEAPLVAGLADRLRAAGHGRSWARVPTARSSRDRRPS